MTDFHFLQLYLYIFKICVFVILIHVIASGDNAFRVVDGNVVCTWLIYPVVAITVDLITRLFVVTFALPSARQHPSYGDCLEVKREYYQKCSVLGCVTQCSQSAAHLCEQFLQVRQIGFVTLGPLRCA